MLWNKKKNVVIENDMVGKVLLTRECQWGGDIWAETEWLERTSYAEI